MNIDGIACCDSCQKELGDSCIATTWVDADSRSYTTYMVCDHNCKEDLVAKLEAEESG